MFVNINKQGSTVQNSTRKHTKREEKVKLDKAAHQDASAQWKLRHSPWIISPLKNFFFGGGGGGQICNDEYMSKNSKNVDFDCIMKEFFDERKYCNGSLSGMDCKSMLLVMKHIAYLWGLSNSFSNSSIDLHSCKRQLLTKLSLENCIFYKPILNWYPNPSRVVGKGLPRLAIKIKNDI